jgi:SAM-dependent methyltransferase
MFSRVGKILRAYAEKDGRGYPDWAMRYLPILRRFGARVFRENTVLEIGANENGIARFVETRVVAIDIAFEHLQAARTAQGVLPVVADITALPFRDDAFKVCVCMDTFEHIPGPNRYAASDEIVRVLDPAGRGVVGFPAGPRVFRAEERVRHAYRRATGGTIRWLEEHLAEGLPNSPRLYAHFRESGAGTYRVTRTGNATLFIWVWAWKILMCHWPGRGNAVFQVLLRWMVPIISRVHIGRCYRAMIWIEADEE